MEQLQARDCTPATPQQADHLLLLYLAVMWKSTCTMCSKKSDVAHGMIEEVYYTLSYKLIHQLHIFVLWTSFIILCPQNSGNCSIISHLQFSPVLICTVAGKRKTTLQHFYKA